MINATNPPAAATFSRFNFAAFLSDVVSYFGGAVLLSPVTILPLYASYLTHSAAVIALIPTLASFGVLLPQVLGARLVAGRTLYRPFVVKVGIVERVAVLCAFAAMLLLRHAAPLLLLGVPMAFLGVWWCAMGINSPAYTAMLTHAIPAERRGGLFGVGAALGGVAGLGFAAFAGRLLKTLAFPYGFAALAGLACLTLSVGFAPLAFVREVEAPEPEEDAHARAFAILRADAPFRRFVVSQVVFAFQSMPTAIWTAYALRRFHAGAGGVAAMTAVIAVVGGAGFLACGWLADRRGNRAVLLLCTALSAVAALMQWAAPSWGLYLATFAPSAFAASGWQLSNFTILTEFAPPGRVPAYSAANAVAAGSFRVLAPLLGGALSGSVGDAPVFLGAAAASVAALLMLFSVAEPRLKSPPPAGYTQR